MATGHISRILGPANHHKPDVIMTQIRDMSERSWVALPRRAAGNAGDRPLTALVGGQLSKNLFAGCGVDPGEAIMWGVAGDGMLPAQRQERCQCGSNPAVTARAIRACTS
jgi:hypothetical protein